MNFLAPSSVRLTDASCAGATTDHFRVHQPTTAGINPPQADAFSTVGNADFVLASFGAADIDLFRVIADCRDIYRRGYETCEQALNRSGRNPLKAAAAVQPKLSRLFADARVMEPNARVIAVGIPAILPRSGSASCRALLSLGDADLRYLDEVVNELNAAIWSATVAAGVTFVDTYSRFRGHEGCAPEADRWIAPPTAGVTLPTDHPTELGHGQLASNVLDAMLDKPRRYVALGDSYTAGQGVYPQISENVPRCRRSELSYPRVAERALEAITGSAISDDLVSIVDASCTGATTEHIESPQTTAAGVNPPQIERVTSATTDVSFGFGTNDVGAMSVLRTCRNVVQTTESCAASFSRRGVDPFAAIEAFGPRFAATAMRVLARAPNARAYVVGYPAYVPLSGDASCETATGIRASDMAFVDAITRALNAELEAVADQIGARYVDGYSTSVGHDACRPLGVRWLEPLTVTSATAREHPNALWHESTGIALASRISASK